MNIAGFWDVMTWEPRDSTTSLPLCFNSWLCDVKGSFFSVMLQLFTIQIQFILQVIYIHIYLYLYWVGYKGQAERNGTLMYIRSV